jgi:ribokinase
MSVVVVGSYVQDHCWRTERFPAIGETRVGRFSTGPGGKGFNQAIACHRQGVATTFVGALGDDPLADVARRFAASEGLRCLWQVSEDRPTATSSIIVDDEGRNLIVVDLAANATLSAGFAASALADGTRIALAQCETPLDATEAVAKRAKAMGATMVLNPAPMHQALPPELLAIVDILTPNETEFAALMAQQGQSIDAAALAASDDLALHALARSLGVPTVVITLGAAGVFVSHGRDRRGDADAYYRVPPARVSAIDSTGAGDAFSGALVAALGFAPDAPFRAAARHANLAAGMACERVGTATAMVDRAAVMARAATRE